MISMPCDAAYHYNIGFSPLPLSSILKVMTTVAAAIVAEILFLHGVRPCHADTAQLLYADTAKFFSLLAIAYFHAIDFH